MNCTLDQFANEMHFIISQGEDERLYFSTVLGNILIFKYLKFYSIFVVGESERHIWNLATNRYMRTVHEDIRGSIILIPHMQFHKQVYGRSVDATFKDGEPRELYILNSSATEIKKFLDQKDFNRGLKIRPDRSIIPTCETYTKLEHWPCCDSEDNGFLLKIIRAQVIFKQEFLNFNPESLNPGSPRYHPRGFRAYVRDRAELVRSRSQWRYRGMKLSFQIWLDNLGPEIISKLKVSW